MEALGIYIHIPFCERKCYYCDFNSYSGKKGMLGEYVEGLKKEILLIKGLVEEHEAATIFIGGGTPSLLSGGELEDLLRAIRGNVKVKAGAEISMEANPGSLSKENLKAYFGAGVNRLSIGLQACQERLLRKLGRIHSYEGFLSNLEEARRAGFENINVDLMYALPGQRMKDWESSLMQLGALEIPHISAYSLIWEEGTPLARLKQNKLLRPMEEELELEMFHRARVWLAEMGYRHYEISNYAKPGYECKHNIVYWRNQGYVGLGAGAHSYLNKSRYQNEDTIEGYLRSINKNVLPVSGKIELTVEDEISETMFLGLRMTDGIAIEDFIRRFGKSPLEIYPEILPRLEQNGLVKLDSKKISLSSRGIDLSNLVFQELLLDSKN